MAAGLSKFTLRKSMELHARAIKLMPGGVSSNARLWQSLSPLYSPWTIFADRAKGSHIWDVDGNEYIDYRLGFGPVILGHNNSAVHQRIHQYDERGVIYALDNPLELTVAEKIRSLVPSAQMVRFSVSGTEATMHAIRIARAYTSKEKVLKFEGHYHGAHDYVLFSTSPSQSSVPSQAVPSSLGIPKELGKLVIVNEWNNFDAIEKTVKKEYRSLAAIITEPVMGNAGVIPPKDGYLKFLKDLCDRYNIVLIFDEVKTGFRLSPGGAQKLFRVTPHMSTFAKSMSNGYPISLIAGMKEIMEKVGKKKVFHGGTYASNPVSLAAVDATIDEIKKGHVFLRIEKFGKALMRGIRELLHDRKIDGIVQGYPGMFQFFFTKQERVRNYRELLKCDRKTYAKLHLQLLEKGVMIDENIAEPLFTCAAHSDEDLVNTLAAMDKALPAALKETVVEARHRVG